MPHPAYTALGNLGSAGWGRLVALAALLVICAIGIATILNRQHHDHSTSPSFINDTPTGTTCVDDQEGHLIACGIFVDLDDGDSQQRGGTYGRPGRYRRNSEQTPPIDPYTGKGRMFLGVPYAERAIGDEMAKRFRNPKGIRLDLLSKDFADRRRLTDGDKKIGNVCIQRPNPSVSGRTDISLSVDCLTLNVFAPPLEEVKAGSPFPVLVLVHGGELKYGSSADFGTRSLIHAFARRGIVVVSVNYRLGALGFYKFKPNMCEKVTGDYRGLLDIVEALVWVRRYASRFGGDPNKITLAGVESGACLLAKLTITPDLAGLNNADTSTLFQRVILHSGTSALCSEGSVFDWDYGCDHRSLAAFIDSVCATSPKPKETRRDEVCVLDADEIDLLPDEGKEVSGLPIYIPYLRWNVGDEPKGAQPVEANIPRRQIMMWIGHNDWAFYYKKINKETTANLTMSTDHTEMIARTFRLLTRGCWDKNLTSPEPKMETDRKIHTAAGNYTQLFGENDTWIEMFLDATVRKAVLSDADWMTKQGHTVRIFQFPYRAWAKHTVEDTTTPTYETPFYQSPTLGVTAAEYLYMPPHLFTKPNSVVHKMQSVSEKMASIVVDFVKAQEDGLSDWKVDDVVVPVYPAKCHNAKDGTASLMIGPDGGVKSSSGIEECLLGEERKVRIEAIFKENSVFNDEGESNFGNQHYSGDYAQVRRLMDLVNKLAAEKRSLNADDAATNQAIVDQLTGAVQASMRIATEAVKQAARDGDPVAINIMAGVADDLYEGDIVLSVDRAQYMLNRMDAENKTGAVRHIPSDRTLVASDNLIWKTTNLNYFFDPAVDIKRWKEIIIESLHYIEQHTCLHFTESNEGDYLYFVMNNSCSSYVGYSGPGPANISIGIYCMKRTTIVHEVFHALGLIHEQSRPDRDDHIIIDWSNVRKEWEGNFNNALGPVDTLGTPYDFGSVMHYLPSGGSKDKIRPAFTARNSLFNRSIGQSALGVTHKDAFIVNRRYCFDRCTSAEHARCGYGKDDKLTLGYADPDDCSTCKCRTGYSGPRCAFDGGARLNMDQDPDTAVRCKYPSEYILNASNPRQVIASPMLGIDSSPGVCVYRIVSEHTKRIFLNITKVDLSCVDDMSKCENYVSVKYMKDKIASGVRLCCAQQAVELESEDNLVELIFMVEMREDVCRYDGFEAVVWGID